MKKNIARAAAAAFIFAAALPANAPATPGQSVAAFRAWAKSNSALHGLVQKMNEMSAQPYFSASFRTAAGTAGTFESNVGESGSIMMESVAVDTQDERYDVLQHSAVAASLVRTVYGADVAADFAGASKVGRWTLYQETSATVLYRGKRYGYEVAHNWVQVWPLDQVENQAKTLASCVHTECGD